MEHFAGLDVSVKETSISIEDNSGKIVREVKVASEPDVLLQVLKNLASGGFRVSVPSSALSRPEQLQRQRPRRGNHN